NASLPDDFVGAAVIESAGGGPLGGVAVQIGVDGEAAAYTLPSETGTTLAVPLVFKNARGWSTGIQVFNTGTTAAQVTATYSRAPTAGAATPAVQESVTIPPRGGATLYQPANASL